MEASGHIRKVRKVIGPFCDCVVKDEFGQLVVQFEAATLSEEQARAISELSHEFNREWADVQSDPVSRRVYYFPPPRSPEGDFFTLKTLTEVVRRAGIPVKGIR